MQSLNFEAIKAARYLLMNLVLIFISTTSSHASIVLVNDPNLGISADGFNITRDTSTGLEWLDLDLSVGRKFDDLTGVDGSNEFLTGGDFEGFRYATHLELTGAVNGLSLTVFTKVSESHPLLFHQ